MAFPRLLLRSNIYPHFYTECISCIGLRPNHRGKVSVRSITPVTETLRKYHKTHLYLLTSHKKCCPQHVLPGVSTSQKHSQTNSICGKKLTNSDKFGMVGQLQFDIIVHWYSILSVQIWQYSAILKIKVNPLWYPALSLCSFPFRAQVSHRKIIERSLPTVPYIMYG